MEALSGLLSLEREGTVPRFTLSEGSADTAAAGPSAEPDSDTSASESDTSDSGADDDAAEEVAVDE